jgi:hypothetical protein
MSANTLTTGERACSASGIRSSLFGGFVASVASPSLGRNNVETSPCLIGTWIPQRLPLLTQRFDRRSTSLRR